MDTKNSYMKSFDVVTDWILCGFAQRVENNWGINLDGSIWDISSNIKNTNYERKIILLYTNSNSELIASIDHLYVILQLNNLRNDFNKAFEFP